MGALFEDWRSRSEQLLKGLAVGCKPKEVISQLSEDLLEHYVGKDLVDRYDVYQHLMDYWAEVMQDDCYLIAAEGWQAQTYRIIEVNKKGKEVDKGWACDLVPKALVVARYFAAEQGDIAAQQAELEGAIAQMAELEEEHGGEEGAFAELEKVNGAAVKARLKEAKASMGSDPGLKAEVQVLQEWVKLSDRQTKLKKAVKEAEDELDRLAYGKYPELTVEEIQRLVVEDKWLARIGAEIAGEMERVSQGLAGRVKVLAGRYGVALPELTEQVAALEVRVAGHLAKMGFEL
jgi:type I restriction enzyme M protein